MTTALPAHRCRVFTAADFFVRQGVNLGDPLGLPQDLCLGDVYQLAPSVRAQTLSLIRSGADRGPVAPDLSNPDLRPSRTGRDTGERVAPGSEIGEPGARVGLIARYTLVGAQGDTVGLLLLDVAGQLVVLPRAPLAPRVDYTLVDLCDAPQDVTLSDLICVSFARGTMITLADGRQAPIETLRRGDAILTRDHGPQPLRWIGRASLRALGSFAPVVISAGTMGNAGDLVLSQHHRMFLYQHKHLTGMTTSELLVQARYLVDGEAIYLREGGYVDYFSLVFDRHEIIYAEGIPCESLMVDDAMLDQLPVELASAVKSQFPELTQVQVFATEAGPKQMERLAQTLAQTPPWRRSTAAK